MKAGWLAVMVERGTGFIYRLSIVYVTCIYRVPIVYLSCILRISIVYLSYLVRTSMRNGVGPIGQMGVMGLIREGARETGGGDPLNPPV